MQDIGAEGKGQWTLSLSLSLSAHGCVCVCVHVLDIEDMISSGWNIHNVFGDGLVSIVCMCVHVPPYHTHTWT